MQTTAVWVVVSALVLRVLGWCGVPGAGAAGTVALVAVGGIVVLALAARRLGRRVRPPAPRGGGPSLREAAPAHLGSLVRSAAMAGVVVGTVTRRDGRVDTDALAWGSPQSLGPRTVLEVGSITKVVTGVLLADLVGEGVVALDQDVASLLPLPQLAGVTLLQLATHSSGLPRLPRAVVARALLAHPDPYRSFDLPRLLAAVPAPVGRGAAAPVYSNLGFALLGQALARAAGGTYEQLATDRVLTPLGMTSSGFAVPLQARGHDRFGIAVAPWRMSAFAPAGGLRSTVGDLGLLADAVLAPSGDAAGRAVARATEPQAAFGGTASIGLGWMIGRHAIWHNGGTNGSSAWVGARRAEGVGVVLVATSAPRSSFDLAAGRLLEAAATAPRVA